MLPVFPVDIFNNNINAKLIFYLINILIAGIFFGFASVTSSTIFQKNVADNFRGRVTTLLSAFGTGEVPFGYLIGGILIESFPIFLVIILSVVFLTLLISLMGLSKYIKEL